MDKKYMSPERIGVGQRLYEANLAIHAGRTGLAEARLTMPADDYGVGWHEAHIENGRRDRNKALADLRKIASPLPPAIRWHADGYRPEGV